MAGIKEFLTGSELAELTGVSRQYVSAEQKRGKLYLDPTTKKYSRSHAVNLAWIELTLSKKGRAINSYETNNTENTESSDFAELNRQKLIEDIGRTKEAKIKLQLENCETLKDLIPVDLISSYLGSFASGIRTNFLNIGNRIARGDVELQNRIEKEIEKAIEKTLLNAEGQLRKESTKIIAAIQEQQEDSE